MVAEAVVVVEAEAAVDFLTGDRADMLESSSSVVKVTIGILDKSGIQLVQTCPAVKCSDFRIVV